MLCACLGRRGKIFTLLVYRPVFFFKRALFISVALELGKVRLWAAVETVVSGSFFLRHWMKNSSCVKLYANYLPSKHNEVASMDLEAMFYDMMAE